MKNGLIYWVLFGLSLFKGYAQYNCSFTHYSAENGLSQNTVMSILQDRKGFMWFASWGGLHKFDGYGFKIYKTDPKNNVGLSHNRINDIHEDKYGYLWLLSYDDKAHRFDPSTETFMQVPSAEGDHYVNISSIKVLPNGVVWLLTEHRGAMRVTTDRVSHALKTTYYSEESDFIPAHDVRDVFYDQAGNEWILGNNGLGVFRQGSEVPEIFFSEKGKSSDSYQRFYSACESVDEVYFGSDNGRVWRYKKENNRFVLLQLPAASNIVAVHCVTPRELFVATSTDGFFTYRIDTEEITAYAPQRYKEFSGMPVLSVYKDQSSEMWFEQEILGKVLHFNPVTKVLKLESLHVEPAPANRALPSFHIHEDANGYTWVHPYGGGFSFFDRKKNKLIPFFNDPTSGNWHFSNKIHSAYSDTQGNLWMCTHSKGLEKISFHDSPFKMKALIDVSTHESLSNEVRALYEDADQHLWVGLKDGYLRIYDHAGKYKGHLCRDGRVSVAGEPVGGVVYAIMQDKDGNMWLGTKGEGLICAVKRGESYELMRYKFKADDIYSLSDDNIYSIHQDYNGRIWIATFGHGINYIEKGEDGLVRFINHRNNLKNYPIDRCYRTRFITSDGSDHIWVGTTVGILTFDADFKTPDDIVFEHYMHREGDVNSLSNNDVHWITVTEEKEIFFATFGGGLNRFVPSTDKKTAPSFDSYTKEDGLSSDMLLSMQEDKAGNLWICTENGVSRFSVSDGQFENYDSKSLNFQTRFNEAAVVKRFDNRFLFGTSDGILIFNPDSIRKNDFVPDIVFTRLLIRGETVVPEKSGVIPNVINDVSGLTLSHKENIFSLQYSALDMANPEYIKYAYMLEGFEEHWAYVEGQRVATYTNLPKGDYLFKVKSTNSDGVWVDNVRTLPITIRPSFWETPFAYFLYVLAVMLFIFIAVYILFTIFRLKHKVSVEQQISDIKLRFFTDISHELRTPLTLISGPVEHVLEEKELPDRVREQLKTVQRNSDRMLNLVNQILDFRKVQNKRMKLLVSHTDVVALIRRTMKNFEQLAADNKIDFVFETECESVCLWIDEDKFDKILFNLLSNAFKYTKNGKMIKVFLLNEEKTCVVGVQDQGIGIAENKKDSVFIRFENMVDKNLFDLNSTGIGLSLVKELAEMHQAKINLDSKLGEGSTFSVEFLKGREHYDKYTEYLLEDSGSPVENIDMQPEGLYGEGYAVKKNRDEELGDTEKGAEEKELMLLVEDNSELREFLKAIFSNTFSVIEASNGEEGLAKAISFVPDIIVSDIMMAGKDGLEMTKELRTDFNTSHIPIVLLTAKSTMDDQLTGFEYGADAYITKPFSSTYLKARVDNLLARRRKLQEVYYASLIHNTPAQSSSDSIPTDETTQPEVPNISPKDRKFMDKLMELMEKNMDNGELIVEDLARELAMSRSVFFKKLKALTGLSPIEFIREIRIKRAAELIRTNEYSITQVSEMVGINDSRYFSKCFKRVYDMTPTEYKQKALDGANPSH
ncbi:response regulator [Bacteroides sp. OttesenSCG-928-D19]|nr:response regulator [Bacteroides sp. OttesenSCG-928-D19]